MQRKSRSKSLYLILLCITAILFLFSGCAKDKNAEVNETKEVPEFVALNEVVPGRPDIYLIVKVLDNNYWNVIVKGVADAGLDMDCNVYYSGTVVETDWEIQQQLLQNAVDAGADGIIFAPDDSVRLSESVSEVYNSGIPIVLIDTVVNTTDYGICYMTDNLIAGQTAAKEMLEQLHKRGTSEDEEVFIAIQVGSPSSQTISERLAGFCSYWTKNAPEKWKIIDEVKCNEGNIDKAVECANSFFDSYKQIDGVFGSNNGSTVGFARVVKERGRNDVVVIGFDYSAEMADLIKDENYYAATMLQRQYDMGYLGVKSVLDCIDGAPLSCKFRDTGVVVVNIDTLSDEDVQQIIKYNE